MSGPARATAGLLLLGLSLFAVTGLTDPTMAQLACWFLVGLAGALVATYDPSAGAGGAATLYVAVFGMFHGGLVVSYAIIGDEALVGRGDNDFVEPLALLRPLTAVLVGLVCLVAGFLVAARLAPRRDGDAEPAAARDRTGAVGLVAVVVGCGIVFWTLSRGGLSLASGYGDFLEAAATSTYGYGVLLVGYGSAFLLAAGRGHRVLGLVAIGGVGAVLLVLGSRGAVLFPAVAMLYAAAKRRRLRPVVALALAAVGLGVTSIIRVTRTEGLRALTAGAGDFSPWQGLAELGYSIYPVVVVQGWMDGGEEPRRGTTLVAVPLRFLEGVFGGAVPVEEDHRVFNVEIMDRQGPIGGSPIAEAIRNGGIPFVVVLMAAIGALLWLSVRAQGRRGVLWGIVILLPLLIATRNSFAPIPVQWAIGSLMVLMATVGSPPSAATEEPRPDPSGERAGRRTAGTR
ncbi:hypothetical protein ACJ5H2_20400 [Nocardioides sp. R1-1]|uniref:hypothetical protein n=1 Tax=Nocardioides sp. R1-1 TaxID=3383502 RepID=UPI0038D231EA